MSAKTDTVAEIDRGTHRVEAFSDAFFAIVITWRGSWRDCMYNYNHFHTRTHEVLGFARGEVTALFGGSQGRELDLKAGDVAIIPAGVGHRRLRMSTDLLIVGAYPTGGRYDEPRLSEIRRDKAIKRIAHTPNPATDPVYGAKGDLLSIWGVG